MLLQNRQAVTRIAKYYSPFEHDEQKQIETEVHRLVTQRSAKFTNFIEWRTYKLIYRKYAGLYFTLCTDINDSELAYLETIHLFVELLDKYFGSVCELDLGKSCCALCLLLFLWFACSLAPRSLALTPFPHTAVFNFHKVYLLLDTFALGGEVQETCKRKMLQHMQETEQLE